METQPVGRRQPAPWLYLFGVLVWTWTLHGIVALTGQQLFEFPAVILALLGALGPTIVAGFLVVAGRWDPALDAGVGPFFRRAFDPRALPWRWYGAILVLVLILTVVPVLLDATVLREEGLIDLGPGFFLLIGFIAGAVEEPGWRGYAQEGLQRRMPVVVASLIVGVFWAAWHLPMFFSLSRAPTRQLWGSGRLPSGSFSLRLWWGVPSMPGSTTPRAASPWRPSSTTR